MSPEQQFIYEQDDKPTVLAAIRQSVEGNLSWSAVRKLLQGRHVVIGGVLCLDEARRLTKGEMVTISGRAVAAPPTDNDVRILYVDAEVIVADKPSGMTTLRRKDEMAWSSARKRQQPTLDECVPRLIREHAARRNDSKRLRQRLPRLFSVHRIDRDSSGLLMFARTEEAQKKLIQQFAEHKAVRKYLALIPGMVKDQTITTQFIRDRGDGLRGSTSDRKIGQEATTHVRLLRKIHSYSELECRLETGRTNQIRIHLAEAGHPICGDIKYRGPLGRSMDDDSKVHRLALHAAVLEFGLPTEGKTMKFETQWPADMQRFLNRLRT